MSASIQEAKLTGLPYPNEDFVDWPLSQIRKCWKWSFEWMRNVYRYTKLTAMTRYIEFLLQPPVCHKEEQRIITVEPCYNEDLASDHENDLVISGFVVYQGLKKKCKELWPAKVLTWGFFWLGYIRPLYYEVPLYTGRKWWCYDTNWRRRQLVQFTQLVVATQIVA